MAINYLNSIDLNQNELIKARVENQPNNVSAGTGVEGQLYYDTTLDVLKVWSNGSWSELGGGGVDTFTNSNGTFVSASTQNTGASGAVSMGSIDLSATGTPSGSTFLRGDNTWASVPQGDITDVLGGTYISIANSAGPQPTVNHDLTSRADTSSASSPAHGATFTAVDSVTSNTTGHITALNLKTVTLPQATVNTDNYVDSIAFSTATGILTLGRTGALPDLTKDLDGRYGLINNQTVTLTGDITGSGTTSIVTTISAGVINFAMIKPSVVITESEGIGNNDNDTTWPTTAAVKDYVDSSVAGQLVYQGGYNAATNTPNLDATPTITIKTGFTWTVTADGLFFGEQVRVGDLLIAEIDTPTTLADWTTVQNNIDLADAATVGIGNVAAGTGISVAYSSGTATVTNTDTNTSNTATGTIAIGALSGTVNHTFGVNTIVQTIDSSGNTVICDISRTATTSTATIAATELTAITILVQKIG